MPHVLDEFPVHQLPLSMAHPGTSDRNSYDRCYLNAHDRSGKIFLITGMGVYPNLGVIDAYATVRIGDRQVTVRTSDALGDDRMRQQVGPYRIEVIEPLRRFRVICDGDDHGVGFDLTWEGSFPAVDEAPHTIRRNGRIILDAQRFAQVGTWDDAGMWWMYLPLRFDDFAIVVIVQEEPDGTRTLNEAVRAWPFGSGRAPEQLGWPEFEVTYTPGTRHPERCVVHLNSRIDGPLRLEVESLGPVARGPWPGLRHGPGVDPWPVAGSQLGRGFGRRRERPGGRGVGAVRCDRPCRPGPPRRRRRVRPVRTRVDRPSRPDRLPRHHVGEVAVASGSVGQLALREKWTIRSSDGSLLRVVMRVLPYSASRSRMRWAMSAEGSGRARW